MKTGKYRKNILAAALAAALALSLGAVGALASGDEVYINGSPQPGTLDGMYALGSGGVTQLSGSGQYVMTANGLAQLGSGASVPEGDPEHLEVTGTLELPYDKVRVALYYYADESSVRNPTLDYANLENEVGSGYDFGYYDSEREFHALGGTDETEITMVIDRNTSTGGGTVGCYHIRLPGAYSTYDEALSAASEYSDGFPAYYNGRFYALYGEFETAGEAQLALDAAGGYGEVYTASDRCVVVTRTEDASILFEFDCGSQHSLAVEPRSTRGDALTWFRGYTYRGGFEYTRRDGERLTVVNVVDIEDYVKGVLPYEMSDGWPLEALKAQAMCARTYVASRFNALSTYNCDVTNDTYSQVYRGTNASTSGTDAAVEATEGLYITYDGKAIDALYCSSNGGATENSENVMYSAVPYLVGKVDPYEAASNSLNANSSWTKTVTGSQLASAANRYGYALSNVTDVELELSGSGNVIGLTMTDSDGRTATFRRSECYNLVTAVLGLNSIHFDVSEASGGFAFTGGGWGHSLGMSQYGAYAMADTYGFTFDQIINFYYTGVELSRGVVR